MERTHDEGARRVADLLQAFAYLALAVFFLDAIIDFVHYLRYESGVGAFFGACWEFLKDLFRMGVVYLGLLAASHALRLLLDIKGQKSGT